ncbi:MAG: methionyl-tRNA formyltransferase [Bacteroidales bacterium]
MSSNSIRIVFMGTPEFAVAPLKALIEAGMEVSAVVTAPDKPAGRGKKLKSSAIKAFAHSKLNCPVLQPEKLKDPVFTNQLRSFNAHLFIVVAFRMLPEVVWSIPKHGTVNLHASLLPQYRGAAPINWCLINGEGETGVTTFLIDQQIDTGRILLQDKIRIGRNENAGSLHDRLMTLGAALVVTTVRQIMEGTVEAIAQDAFDVPQEKLKKAPRIYKDDCRIEWNRSREEVHNLVRGMSPSPGAFTMLCYDDQEPLQLKIFETLPVEEEGADEQCNSDQNNREMQNIMPGSSDRSQRQPSNIEPGTILSDQKSFMMVACSDGWLEVRSLQPAGRKRMSGADFIRGFKGEINHCKMK